jgi:hypothetical protein
MVRWQKHAEGLDETRSHCQRAGREIAIGAAAVAEAERATIMGPVNRAAVLKGKGVSTARHSAIYLVYTVVLGSPIDGKGQHPSRGHGRSLVALRAGGRPDVGGRAYDQRGAEGDHRGRGCRGARRVLPHGATASTRRPRGSARKPLWPSCSTPPLRKRTTSEPRARARAAH